MKLVGFRFNYKRTVALDHVTKAPVLDSRTGRPMEVFHPMVPCIIASERRTSPQIDALLDSGSDGIVIPKTLADYLGLSLKQSDKPMRIANGRSIRRLTARAHLTIGRGGRRCDPVDIEVSVPEEGDPPIPIGREPVFRLFVITFVEAEKWFGIRPCVVK